MFSEKFKAVGIIEETIFKPSEYLKVTHKLDNEIFNIEIPMFTNTELRLTNLEVERIKKQIQVQLEWLNSHEILKESNYEKLYSLSLIFLNLFSTCKTNGDQIKEKCFEIFVSIGILLSIADDFCDDTKEGQDKLEEMCENSAYYTSTIIGFIEDILSGEYNGVDDLPEEALNFYPEFGQVIKLVQVRIDELKRIERNYMDTYKYLFEENFKVVQATFIMLLNQKKQDLPPSLATELQLYINGGSYFYEMGLAFLESPIDTKIRNHVYFSKSKNLFLEIGSKLNLLCGIGGDYDSEFGVFQNQLLQKWKTNQTNLSLEALVKEEESNLKKLLIDFHELGEEFLKLYPYNPDIENLVDFGKECYNSTLRGYYLSGIYTERKRKLKDSTMIQHCINNLIHEPQTFHDGETFRLVPSMQAQEPGFQIKTS